MMDSWHTVRIGDLCEGIYDGPHATPKKTIDGPIFLGISNLSNGRIDLSNAEHLSEKDYISWTRRIVPQENDVVFSYETRLGEAARIPGGLRCCLGRRMALMRPNLDKVHPTFLHFAYLSPSFQETIRARTVRGSTVDRIALIEFPDFPITIPADLDEQRTIAHMLGSLDDKIELNRRMNATLEESAHALFKSWFVDFDPVRAKMEGRQPEGIDVETAALFPDRLVESMLGFIPDGWRVGTLGEIASNPRRSVQPKQMLEGTLYIGLEHMPQRSISLSDWGAATDVESNKYQFFTGELLFGKLRPYFHKVGIAPIDGICSTDVLVITPVADYWWGTVLMLISSVEFVNETTLLSGGTRMPRVNWSDMAHYKIVIPMPNVAQMFSEFVEQVGKLIIRNIHQWHLLVVTRDALLPKLLSGEVRVGQLNVGEYNYE